MRNTIETRVNPTPGKWKILKVANRNHWEPIHIHAVEDGNQRIITIEPIGSVYEQMANANLVIAAKDMLEAIKTIIIRANTLTEEQAQEWENDLLLLEAAACKAEGR